MNENIWIPALVAALGFVAKSLFDTILTLRNKKIEILENRLERFYWPILIRLEKDNSVWESILSKREDESNLLFKVAKNVEHEFIMKNHQEIMDLLSSNIHIAAADEELKDCIRRFIKNVTLYKALRSAGEEKLFPYALGAEWPEDFYFIIKERTEKYQNELNDKLLI